MTKLKLSYIKKNSEILFEFVVYVGLQCMDRCFFDRGFPRGSDPMGLAFCHRGIILKGVFFFSEKGAVVVKTGGEGAI